MFVTFLKDSTACSDSDCAEEQHFIHCNVSLVNSLDLCQSFELQVYSQIDAACLVTKSVVVKSRDGELFSTCYNVMLL